jgi:hypothetical protein
VKKLYILGIKKNQPFDYPWSNPSTPLRTSTRGLPLVQRLRREPFDRLKALSSIEGLSRTLRPKALG